MKNIKILFLLVILLLINTQGYTKAEVNNNDSKYAYLNLQWWDKLNDPILTGYLVKAYESNHDLKIVSAKIKQGEQIVKQSLSQEIPQIAFLGDFDRTFRSSTIQHGTVIIPEYSQSQFTLPLSMNYEIDIWRKNYLKTKSAKEQLEILKQSEKATHISLTSLFASNYYNLVKIDKMIEYQNQILSIQKTILSMIEAKYQNGLTSIIEVNNEKKKLTILTDENDILKQDREVLLNQIRTILAIQPVEKLDRISLDKISLISTPSEINSEIIQNRPDFLIAQSQLKKTGIDIKIAEKEILPSFIITGQVGFNSYQLRNMFNSKSLISSIGFAPIWDIFTGGRKKALLKLKKYEYEEAGQNYEKVVLTSLQEVNDSLLLLKTAKKNYKKSIERLNLEHKNYELTSQKYQIGGISLLEKLKEKEFFLVAKKNEVSNKINCIISTIGLYKAVGGKDLYTLNQVETAL